MAVYTASHRGLITATLVANSADPYITSGQIYDASVPLSVTDHRSLIRTTGNQVRGAFAFSVLQTQRELEASFGAVSPDHPPDAEAPDANLWTARSVLGLIAHSVDLDLMSPIWHIPREYRRTFEVASLGFTMDAISLQGQEMRWGHFGGLLRYLDLVQFVSHCLDGVDIALALQVAAGNYGALAELADRQSYEVPSASPINDVGGYGSGSGRLNRPRPSFVTVDADAPAGWIAPDGPPEPRISVASQATQLGPIDDFVANACSTGSRAMNLAGDLYTSYANWCLDHGYLAHSQRKFGLELRARGYERRRRGKGRHWWVGVESHV